MTLKGRGADQLSLEERLVPNTRTCALIEAWEQHRKHMACSLPPKRTHTHRSRMQLLRESIMHLKAEYCQGEGSLCLHSEFVRSRTCTTHDVGMKVCGSLCTGDINLLTFLWQEL